MARPKKRTRSKKRTHRWTYPRAYDLARAGKPATCPCGATLHYVKRLKKGNHAASYGGWTDDCIFTFPDGSGYLINPSPVPACTRKA